MLACETLPLVHVVNCFVPFLRSVGALVGLGGSQRCTEQCRKALYNGLTKMCKSKLLNETAGEDGVMALRIPGGFQTFLAFMPGALLRQATVDWGDKDGLLMVQVCVPGCSNFLGPLVGKAASRPGYQGVGRVRIHVLFLGVKEGGLGGRRADPRRPGAHLGATCFLVCCAGAYQQS